MIQKIDKKNFVRGELEFGGDKSISHRAVIFSALAKGKSKIINCSSGEDVRSTINCLRQLGCEISFDEKELTIISDGAENFKNPKSVLNAGNSGTTARLLCGILIHQKFESEIVGDQSLSSRPMKRIIEPLQKCGAMISARENNFLPLKIFPSEKLSPQKYDLNLGSAQVKSAILLSGLFFEESTAVREYKLSRDHTERMLRLPISRKNEYSEISVSKNFLPVAKEYIIPSDISSAAFFIVSALLHKNSEALIKNVSLNPTRTAFIKVLQQMGGEINIVTTNDSANEPFGDLLVKSSELRNVEIKTNDIPLLIDEIPILTIAGLFAEGKFEIRNAKELRVKESDRISALLKNIALVGVAVDEFEDGFAFEGRKNKFNKDYLFESFGDHRIAMSFAILSSLLERGGKINNFECVNISNPNFLTQLLKVTG